jgi:tRNA threonylcarbamoyladenosine biosynthesis protein TsaB
MANLLHFETATTLCSVCIATDGVVVAERALNEGYTHAENLGKFIEECLAEAKMTPADLDAIAVGKGPGSYTGLRIGVSTAKGLAYSLEIPLISIPTLETLIHQPELTDFDGILVPMLDARRMEVYCAVFSKSGKEILPTEAKILDENSFSEFLTDEKVAFIGDGAAKFEALIQEHPNASFFPEIYPSASGMVKEALLKFQKREVEDVAYFEPFYLKDFVATTPKNPLAQKNS